MLLPIRIITYLIISFPQLTQIKKTNVTDELSLIFRISNSYSLPENKTV